MNYQEIKSETNTETSTAAGKTVKLRTLMFWLAGLVIMIVAFFTYQYISRQTGPVVPIPSLTLTPRFLFNIYGARGVKLVRPMSVFFDDKDRLIYIANTEGHTIDVFKAQGEYLFSFGGFGSGPGKLSYPYGVARMRNGDILVAEAGNRRVQRFSSRGRFLGMLFDQPNEYKIEKPGPLYIDSKGSIYIGDLSGGKVVVLDEQGRVVKKFLNVQYPHGIAVDEQNGLIYIANGTTKEINAYSLGQSPRVPTRTIKGDRSFSPDGQFSMVRGMAVDGSGNLYVVDSITCAIRVFDVHGNYRYSFGAVGYDDGSLLYPNGIDIGDDGRIYIADWGNNRVSVWGQ